MLNTLNVSQTGLNAARIAVENVSNNIANESTAGYKKRVVQLSELDQMDSQFAGRGVSVNGTYRVTSQYMYDKLVTENSKSNYFSKLSNMMGNVESIFTETTDSGFSADLNRYYQAIENLRTDPNSQSYKTSLQNQGNVLVDSLQNLYTSVVDQQKSEKKELYSNVDNINGILKDIGLINEKIQKFGETNDLLDKRDQLELNLSDYVDINVSRNDGYYELKIGNLTAISNNTNVRTIELKEEDTKQIDKYILPGSSTEASSITFSDNKFDDEDIVTYKLNNQFEVSVKFGEIIPDVTKPKNILTGEYPSLDINGDGNFEVSKDELVRALVFKINTNTDTKGLVTAYNGTYTIDQNGQKVTNDKQDNYLRIESLNGGVANDFQGRLYIEEHPNITYSTYSPQEGDIISLSDVVNNSDLSKALSDSNRFTNNLDGTYTATANAGNVRLIDGETIQKTFVQGAIVTPTTLQPASELSKALVDTNKFIDNLDGTYTATALAGTIKISMDESITVDTPTTLAFLSGDLIDTNSAVINSGSMLEDYLADSAVFQELSPGSGIYKALVSSDGSTNDSFGNPVNGIALEKGESISKLKIESLNVGLSNIPVGSIIKPDNLIAGSSLSTLLSDGLKFNNNGDGTFTVKLSNGPVANSDFQLTGSENISITLSQEVSLANDFSYTPPSSYDSGMISNMKLDGVPVVWDNINGVVTDGTTPISLTQDAKLTFDVSGNIAGNKVDLKAGDIVEIINENWTNGTSLSENILSSGNWIDNGNGTYIAIEDQTITLDDANDKIGVTRNILVTNSQIKEQDAPGIDVLKRIDITTTINFDEIVSSGEVVRNSIFRNEDESTDPESKVSIGIYDNEITLKSGIMKAQIDNLSSDSPNNKFQTYLDKLDSFAQTLSDISDTYIQNGTDSYIYGDTASDESTGTVKSLGLFSGSSIKTLRFNESMVNDLTQDKLDYLATIQWKSDLTFDGKGQNANVSNKSSLSEFFRDLRVIVSSNKENVNFSSTTQDNVTMSLQNTYDQLTKVDKDDEMLDLLKFQAAYTANAKMITAIDEMLQTLLGMKR